MTFEIDDIDTPAELYMILERAHDRRVIIAKSRLWDRLQPGFWFLMFMLLFMNQSLGAIFFILPFLAVVILITRKHVSVENLQNFTLIQDDE